MYMCLCCSLCFSRGRLTEQSALTASTRTPRALTVFSLFTLRYVRMYVGIHSVVGVNVVSHDRVDMLSVRVAQY